jgi:hypothetical protein
MGLLTEKHIIKLQKQIYRIRYLMRMLFIIPFFYPDLKVGVIKQPINCKKSLLAD